MKSNNWKVKDLAGCDVYDLSEKKLGILVDVLPTGNNDIWVVKSFDTPPKELLIPALVSVIKEVDLINRKIIVDMPLGLKEIYED